MLAYLRASRKARALTARYDRCGAGAAGSSRATSRWQSDDAPTRDAGSQAQSTDRSVELCGHVGGDPTSPALEVGIRTGPCRGLERVRKESRRIDWLRMWRVDQQSLRGSIFRYKLVLAATGTEVRAVAEASPNDA